MKPKRLQGESQDGHTTNVFYHIKLGSLDSLPAGRLTLPAPHRPRSSHLPVKNTEIYIKS